MQLRAGGDDDAAAAATQESLADLDSLVVASDTGRADEDANEAEANSELPAGVNPQVRRALMARESILGAKESAANFQAFWDHVAGKSSRLDAARSLPPPDPSGIISKVKALYAVSSTHCANCSDDVHRLAAGGMMMYRARLLGARLVIQTARI